MLLSTFIGGLADFSPGLEEEVLSVFIAVDLLIQAIYCIVCSARGLAGGFRRPRVAHLDQPIAHIHFFLLLDLLLSRHQVGLMFSHGLRGIDLFVGEVVGALPHRFNTLLLQTNVVRWWNFFLLSKAWAD